MYETPEIARDGGVATLWMNRPDVHNAFNEQLIAELTAACRSWTPTTRCAWWCWPGAARARRRRPQLDEARRQCQRRGNLEDARKLAGMLRTLAEMTSRPSPAHGRPWAAAWGSPRPATSASRARGGVRHLRGPLRHHPSAISPYVIRAIGARQAIATSRPPSGSPPARRAGPGPRGDRGGRPRRQGAGHRHRPAAGRAASQAAAKDLIRAVADRPSRPGRGHRPPHCQPARHAGSEGGPRRFLDKRPAAWVSA
jgi:methylglutaconyl-CoA hydratase